MALALKKIVTGLLAGTLVGTLAGCDRIDSLLMEPEITGEAWCEGMPCIELFSSGMILNQPFSTLIVYILGLLWIWAGLRFWKTRNGQESRTWWSLSLLLGGIAALSAGTSYQAFGYQLKCAGRDFCTWTSWWEIAYLTIQVGSMNTMVVAVAYSCTQRGLRRALIAYSVINFILHLIFTITGALIPNRFMISFELLVLFTAPTFFIYFAINGYRYLKFRHSLDLALLLSWVIMLMANVFYFGYLWLGITPVLWEQGIWFSENDVLHLFVMLWVFYVGLVLVPKVSDYPAGAAVEDART